MINEIAIYSLHALRLRRRETIKPRASETESKWSWLCNTSTRLQFQPNVLFIVRRKSFDSETWCLVHFDGSIMKTNDSVFVDARAEATSRSNEDESWMKIPLWSQTMSIVEWPSAIHASSRWHQLLSSLITSKQLVCPLHNCGNIFAFCY